MFSRVGKFTADRHQILRKKEEIINNKQKKVIRVSSLPIMNKADKQEGQGSKRSVDDVIREHENRAKKDKEQPGSTKPSVLYHNGKRYEVRSRGSSTFTSLSRATYYHTKRARGDAPPIGHYLTSYSQVTPHVKTPEMHRTIKKSFSKVDLTERNVGQEKFDQLERPFSRVQSLKFNAQLSRKPLLDDNGLGSPHESRFDNVNLNPYVWERYKHTVSPDFDSIPGRDGLLYKQNDNQPMYSPKYEFVEKRTPSCGMAFHRASRRKPLISGKDSAPDMNAESLEKSTKFISPRTTLSVPDFDIMTARGGEMAENSELPTWMQGIHNRTGMEALNEKHLSNIGWAHSGFRLHTPSAFDIRESKSPEFKNYTARSKFGSTLGSFGYARKAGTSRPTTNEAARKTFSDHAGFKTLYRMDDL